MDNNTDPNVFVRHKMPITGNTRKDVEKTIIIYPHRLQVVDAITSRIILFILLVIVAGLDFIPSIVMWWILALALVLGLSILYRYYYTRTMKYEITDDQLIFEHGIFTTKREFIELYRIIDYEETRSFFQNFIGLKTIKVLSGDKTTPQLNIYGVKAKTEIVNILRKRVERNKQNHPIYEITNR